MPEHSFLSTKPSFTLDERKLLMEVARQALELGVRSRESLADLPGNENIHRPGGAFVTLRIRNRLRGCIGQLPSQEPLIRVVAHCAKVVALEDPRFEPVRGEELPKIEIELSILSPLKNAIPEEIEPGKHGIMVSQGWKRGVLLPQVATQFHWDVIRFLEETCVKAELERNAWKDPSTQIQIFTAEISEEAEIRAGD